MKYHALYFGQAYGEGAYGAGNYSCTTQQQADGQCTVAASSGGSNGSGGSLTDTGIGIIAVATLACLIIFAALIVRVWRRKPVVQPVAAESEPTAVTRQ